MIGLLRDELGFDGVVLSDALDMRAISAGVGRAAGAVAALGAGVDLLCIGNPVFPEPYDAEAVSTRWSTPWSAPSPTDRCRPAGWRRPPPGWPAWPARSALLRPRCSTTPRRSRSAPASHDRR